MCNCLKGLFCCRRRRRGPPSLSDLADPEWERTDPNPDVRELYTIFNARFFHGVLPAIGDQCQVLWSDELPLMILCVGITTPLLEHRAATIELSEPVLKFRTRLDTVETLLHEMVHFYLIIIGEHDEQDHHGARFREERRRLKQEANIDISITFPFTNEVMYYFLHEWRCNGPCRNKPPRYGYVRLKTHRPPGPCNTGFFWWYFVHQRKCGGKFVKMRDPLPPPQLGD